MHKELYILVFSKTIPIVPPKDRINPTSKIINGLYKRSKKHESPIQDIVSGCFEKISEKITQIAISPALKTEEDAPDTRAKETTIKIDARLDTFLPKILSSKNLVAITI